MFGAKTTTAELLYDLHGKGQKVDLIVSLGAEARNRSHISGGMDIERIADDIGADYHPLRRYDARHPDDEAFFRTNRFGIGFAYGWQRLIPRDVLDAFEEGVFGWHGSRTQLPLGKGRSPFNWSIIEGGDRIYYNLFKYVESMDAGPIFDTRKFEILPTDDILSLQVKALLVAKQQIAELLVAFGQGHVPLREQSGESSFYEKRTPADGKIDFGWTTLDIFNLVRAVARPFPGARCLLGDVELTVWSAIPFGDVDLDLSGCQPGEVVDVVYDLPILRTVDGALLVREIEPVGLLSPGDRVR